ncbi:MAG: hypothetical protein AB1782_08150 [Cyanobacteriota bacterium]
MNKILKILFCIFVIGYCTMLSVFAENENQGFPGILDLSEYDAPLSYIDRQPYQQLSPEEQKKKFDEANEYVKSQQAQQELKRQQAIKDLDVALQSVAKIKQQYDQSRKSYNNNTYNYNYYDPYYNDGSGFSTEVNRYGAYRRPVPPPCASPCPYNNYYGYQPYMNIFNMPGYIGNSENQYDGIDNDRDSFVDEGFHKGNVQIVLRDSGANKDDEWNLFVDGKYLGSNMLGTVRTWDLDLFSGTHTVTIVGSSIPDGSGTYSIAFKNANIVSGPPLVGENMRQGQSLQWVIQVR